MSLNKDFHWLIWFVLLAVLLRLPSMFVSVIDHDESTYIIIAQQLLDGGIPYVVNVDVKPVGIYLLFATVLNFFQSTMAIRIFAALVVGLSGFLLFRAHETIFQDRKVAIASGALFVVCGSLHKWSWSANTEIFFVACSLGCLLILLLARRASDFVWFGLLAGFGFLIKFHIAFDLLAMAVYYFFWSGKGFLNSLKDLVIAFCSFCFMLLAVCIYYYSAGYWAELKFAMITIPSSYASSFSMGKMLAFVGEFYLSFIPIALLLLVGIGRAYLADWMRRPEWIFFWSWTILAWLGIVITGKFFFHYYFQALPVFCLFAFTYFLMDEQRLSSLRQNPYLGRLRYGWYALVVLGIWGNQWQQVLSKPDVPELVARDLEPEWRDGDKVYTNYKNILYFLLDTDPPIRYTHTTVIYDKQLSESYQVDVEKTLGHIVEQEMDYYVIAGTAPDLISQDLERNFELVKTYPGDVILYKRVFL